MEQNIRLWGSRRWPRRGCGRVALWRRGGRSGRIDRLCGQSTLSERQVVGPRERKARYISRFKLRDRSPCCTVSRNRSYRVGNVWLCLAPQPTTPILLPAHKTALN